MPMSDHGTTLSWTGRTDRGRYRPNNEDHFLAFALDSLELRYLGKDGEASLSGCDYVFAVSDGMGGERSGEFASRIATDKITRLLPASFRLSAQGLSAGFGDVFAELFTSIHLEMQRMSGCYEECRDMGATLTLVWVTPTWVYFAHIGDSRLYYLPKGGGLKQLSDDHSHVGWLRRQGKLTEREARNHPRKNVLGQALGAGHQFVEPQIGAVAHEPGDRFLLCSDGITDGLWDHMIADVLQSPGEGSLSAQLIVRAIDNGSRDNLTAIVLGMTQS
jgi:PPM family protein phosphatase